MKIIYCKVALFIIVLFFKNCYIESESDIFFRTVEKRLGNELVSAFKNLPSDSIMIYEIEASNIIREYLFSDSVLIPKTITFVEENKISSNWADYYTMFSFHNYLNQVEESRFSILEKCYKSHSRNIHKAQMIQLERSMKYNWMALSYHNKYKLGDAIQFVFPLLSDSCNAVSSYQNKPIGSLVLQGRLIQKKIIVNGDVNSNFYRPKFYVKILSFNNRKCNTINGKNFELNDTLAIDMYDYAEIEENLGVFHK